MKLSDLFRSTSVSRSDENGESVVASQKNQNTLRINRQIKALMPGQTLHGEVVSKNGGEVQIKLADDMVLSARLEREMAIDPGKIMTFEVRNNGKTLTLSPLFANTATDANVLKALDMANVPVNEASVEMTQTMMEQGMSIDRNSIQNVYRDVSANMDAAVRDIVQLHQLNVEVTPNNLNQLQNYKSMQHQIVGAMNQIVTELSGQMETMIQSGNVRDALLLFSKLQEVFLGQSAGGADPDADIMQSKLEPAAVSRDDGVTLQNNIGENRPDIETEPNVQPNAEKGQLLKDVFSGKEFRMVQEALKHPALQETAPKLQDLLARMQAGTATGGDVQKAVTGTELSDFLKNQMLANWLLEPEMVQEKENVDRLYQRISRQLGEMQKVLSEMPAAEQGSAMKSVTNMQNNVDFMNQLNQAFTYVQIPLKMGDKETHGELYVYTNKRNLAREDGNVSAFLHLDMENLDPVDVYIAMQNQKVNTKFYLKDDEMIDFIQAHIHILNERLAKRGYSMNCEMIAKEQEEQETNILERMTESEKSVTVLSRYAFDVRA